MCGPRVDNAVTPPILADMSLSDPQPTDLAEILLHARTTREGASKLLSYLLELTQAHSVSLWRLDGDSIVLEICVDADEDTIRGARSLWAARAQDAVAGTSASSANAILVPTRGHRDSWVYIDGVDPARIPIELVSGGAALALQALHKSQRPGSSGNHHALKRDELVAILSLYEWNISRVARVKGVTRKTIYDWLARYEIPREHVPK